MRYLITLFCVMFSVGAFAQLDCLNALEIPCGKYVQSDNATGCNNTVIGPYCGYKDANYTGREKIYKIVVPSRSTVYLKLSELSADLDMFLLRSCNISDCISSSTFVGDTLSERISATLDAGTYYIVIDGWGGATSKFQLDYSCVAAPIGTSTGELDCTTATPLACGQTLSGTTATGINNVVGPYCGYYCNYSGNEKIFSLNILATSTVTINLSGLTGDLDMFLLNACDRQNCIGNSTYSGNGNEQITKTLTPGTYYIVIDGYAGAVSNYSISATCVPLTSGQDCNALLFYQYSGSGSDLKFNFQFKGSPTNTQFLGWKVNNTLYSTNPNVTFTFQSAGNYNVCAEYKDLITGLTTSCCKKICVSLPTNCETIINYTYTGGKFVLSLNGNTNSYQNISWRNDTDGLDIDPNNMPANCRNLLISVRYFDTNTQCWNMCCRRITFCAPTSCQDAISYQWDANNNQFVFNFSFPGATNLVWKFDDDGTTIPDGKYKVPTNFTCKDRTVTVYYLDTNTGCWRVCCRKLYLCPPVNCEQAIQYTYYSTGNKYRFTLNIPNATSPYWKFDEDGTWLQYGEFPVPSNWTCKDRTITVTYFDTQSQSWKNCCRKVYICPPVNCEQAIQYQYYGGGNKFVFTLNYSGAQNLYWKIEEENLVLTNAEYRLPAGVQCQNRTVSAYYFDPLTLCWRVCSRKVYLCAPTSCETAIQYTYIATSNKYKFTLNVSGATNPTWKFDDDGTILPNGEFVIPANWTCKDRTITVNYWDPTLNCWRLCCRKVTICPPVNCQEYITHEYVAVGNKYKFTFTKPGVTNVTWKVEEDGTTLPNGEFYIPGLWTCRDKTISAYYYDPVTQCWSVCSKKVGICPPLNCQDGIKFSYDAAGNRFVFTLDLSGVTNLSWKFDDDGTVLPNGIFYLPSGWTCAERTVTVYYFDTASQCWRVCCKKVTLCPPVNCQDAIQYTYDDTNNKYKFVLATATSSSISWKFAEDGTVLTNGEFVIPSNWTCKERTVVVEYYNATTKCWSSCSRKLYICPPFNCQGAIQYAYNAGGNSVTFTLNGNLGSITNITWTVEETGQQLGTGSTSLPLLVSTPCGDRTISARYMENGVWKLCCKRVYICNPGSCTGVINSTTNGTQVTVSIDPSYTDVKWTDGAGNALGSGSPLTFTAQVGSITVIVHYLDPTTKCYRTCSKDITITCPPPVSNFTFVANGNGVTFTNTSTGATSYTWTFGGGVPAPGSTTTSTNPVAIYPSGQYNVCLTAINSCGSKTTCQQVVVNSGTECTFDLDDNVCGAVGSEVIVPVKVSNFKDVLTFNFTIRCDDTTAFEIKGCDNFNSTIQSGSYHFVEKDHIRFFWSDPIGKSLNDDTQVFGVRVKIKAQTANASPISFSNYPVKIEGYDKNQQLLAIQVKAGSVCANQTVNMIGNINTVETTPVAQTTVRIKNTNYQQTTDNSGSYTFNGIASGTTYEILPSKNTEPLNGVNALDIVRLQRHLLVIEPLNTPYKLIAADVNNDENINALDIVTLQRLQLRIIDSFPNNASWRFVPVGYNFTTNNPLTENFPESILINNITSNQNNLNFYGIKVGDLNGSADPNRLTNETDRGAGDTVKMIFPDTYKKEDQVIVVPVKTSNFNSIFGLQSTITWDTAHLQFDSVGGFSLNSLTNANFGKTLVNKGLLLISWFDATGNGVSIADNSELFKLYFTNRGNSGSNSVVTLAKYPLEPLAVGQNNQELPVVSDDGSIFIVSPLTYTSNYNSVKCFGAFDGTIELNTEGGSLQYEYNWSNGATTAKVVDLPAGTYQCTVTDKLSNQELITNKIVISQPQKLTVDFEQYADSKSPGKYAVNAYVNGGTSPFTYLWSNGSTNAVLSGIEAGEYGLTVTDDNGCALRSTVVILSTGVKELTLGKVRIFPNPTTGRVNISIEDYQEGCEYEWNLVNLLGQTMSSGQSNLCSSTTVDLGNQIDGLYKLIIRANDKIATFSILIQKP